MEERLIELELRYTHQQELLEQLSAVLYGQQKEITRLAGELRRLREQLASQPEMPADERPPHY
jgi:SlyX protein